MGVYRISFAGQRRSEAAVTFGGFAHAVGDLDDANDFGLRIGKPLIDMKLRSVRICHRKGLLKHAPSLLVIH